MESSSVKLAKSFLFFAGAALCGKGIWVIKSAEEAETPRRERARGIVLVAIGIAGIALSIFSKPEFNFDVTKP